MKISILDDYQNAVRTLACFPKLAGHQVAIWNDHTQDTDALADFIRLYLIDAGRIQRLTAARRTWLIGQE